jgi:hypothetical protein
VASSMVKDRAYDVAELRLTYFLRAFEVDDPPFQMIPVFPVRSFRHSAIYINKASGIERPQDLNDRAPDHRRRLRPPNLWIREPMKVGREHMQVSLYCRKG